MSATQYFIIFGWRGHSIGSQVHNFHIWGENWTHCFNWLKINSDLKLGQLKIHLYTFLKLIATKSKKSLTLECLGWVPREGKGEGKEQRLTLCFLCAAGGDTEKGGNWKKIKQRG